jgi:hypothetical protein
MKAAASGKAESCPMSKGRHHCPGSKKPNVSQAASVSGETAENCCPFISKRFDLARKTETEQKSAVLVPLKFSAPEFFSVKRSFPRVASYPSVVRNRGSTYLTNCVFRI